MFLPILLSVFAFHAGSASCEDSVTLWQFGLKRLAAGATTEPLQVLGPASDGLSTTFLYEVLNFQTTTISTNGGKTTATLTSPVYRTIVASASGWVETGNTGFVINCAFTSDGSGECFDSGNATQTGTATPVVLGVRTSPPAATTSFPVSTTVLPTSTAAPTTAITTASNDSSRPSVAAATLMSLLSVHILGNLLL
ncbi:hypothetical protein GYMLUDRAFT_74607 [Collybiopsis luxurians FD-317 M1]|uniref:Uncharacterized protein n=1 Tax=Collybiopsis luxurians FD-317 M1 TaxID=944289 RepID=A0A0D0BUA5_9AGAR|nr:hypothetical protein GYMLUDRAFT_74607 [Collybiopsis luxurians FD-317 M1]